MSEKHLKGKKYRPDELLLLSLLEKDNDTLFNELLTDSYYVSALIKLSIKGVVSTNIPITTKIKMNNVSVVKDMYKLFFSRPTMSSLKTKVKGWIQEYRDLYPKGMNPNGYPFKGDKQGCINNMAKFLLNYPEFDNKELILNATKSYLDKKKKDNYDYVSMADRFIWKNGMSTLAGYCEQLKDGTIKNEKRNVINM